MFIDFEVNDLGGYQLTQDGALLPMGQAPPLQIALNAKFNAAALSITPNSAGGWIAVDDYIKRIGRQPELVLYRGLNQGKLLVDIEYDSAKRRMAILFEDGSLVVCSQQAPLVFPQVRSGEDQPVDIEFYDDKLVVLTQRGTVYRVDQTTSKVDQSAPTLSNSGAVDLEFSPFGDGYYVLDNFGVIHACGGAPAIETERLERPDAVDLEWISSDEPPRWYPTGWSTQVDLDPDMIRLDPEGQSKYLSLRINGAENMRRFVAELRFDPALLMIEPNRVSIGPWWSRSINTPNITASVDEDDQGLLRLHATGSATIVGGANGGGVAAVVPVAPAPGVKSSTATVSIDQFFFEDAALSYPYRLNTETAPTLIQFQSMAPLLGLEWTMQTPAESGFPTVGSVIRVDLFVQHGGRVQTAVFDMKFDNQSLRLLGVTPGEVWAPYVPLDVQLATPSLANPAGEINNQTIQALESGACQDARLSLITMFFEVQQPGRATVAIKNLNLYDEKKEALASQFTENTLYWTVQDQKARSSSELENG